VAIAKRIVFKLHSPTVNGSREYNRGGEGRPIRGRGPVVELRGLRSLVALSELGSITRGAERLNLSAAARHKPLKGLEAELEVPLYEKVANRLRLTAAGEALLPHVKRVLAEYETALSALDEWKGLRRASVRIGTGPTMSSYVLPPILREFRRRFPD